MQNNLLDTHTFIWFIEGSSLLSEKAKKEIQNESAFNFFSVASLWEIAIKVSLGKTFEDTVIISGLPFHHRDPFDRIIIAQAITNKMTIISKDETFASYDAKVIW